MALSLLTSLDAGLVARSKINAGLTAVDAEGKARSDADAALSQRLDIEARDRVAADEAGGKARSDADTVLAESITALGRGVQSGNDALRALFDARRFDFTQPVGRVGDLGLAFALAASVPGLQGANGDLGLLPDAYQALGENGSVVRVVGSAIVGMRRRVAIEVGRLYRARFVVQRRANASDPSNDTVRLAAACFDAAGNLLPGRDGVVVVADLNALTVANGRTERQTTMARQPGAGTLVQLPRAARSVRVFVQCFGSDGVTDLEVLDLDDISNATILPAVSADAMALLNGLLSQNLAARLGTAESRLQNPNSLTFASQGDAASATIDGTVTTIGTRGGGSPGDGNGADYRRVASAPPAGRGFRTADGAYWRRIDPVSPSWIGQPTVADPGPAWASYNRLHNTLRVAVNDFPIDAQVGSNAFGFAEAIVGGVDIPSTSKAGNHSAGVAGYARTASNDQGGVGLFGMASIVGDGNATTGKSAWSFNSIITNAARHLDPTGFDNAVVFGGEWDVNLRKLPDGSMPNAPLRMFYVIGDSNTMSKGVMRVFDIDTLGYYTPGVQWKEILFSADGASAVALNLGATGRPGAASDGQSIQLRALGPNGAGRSGRMQLTSSGDLVLSPFGGSGLNVVDTSGQIGLQAASGLFKINADGQGARTVSYAPAGQIPAGFRALVVPA